MADPFIGEIRMFAGTFAPQDWAFCQGQLLPIQNYQALFTILGTTYGGNGTTTFGLPNLQSRSPVGTGTGPGLSNVALGQVAGTEQVTLNQAQLPSFNVSLAGTAAIAIPANTSNGTSKTPASNSVLSTAVDTAAGAEVDIYAPLNSGSSTTLAPFNANITAQGAYTGANQPVPTRNPYLGMNFIIALTGIYPPRN
ncbi:Microcystin-dependent protein [Rheinheimera pacifica]|uniref:Microcystin-dependent protein n=1 Tax=Rheinheimera pacifica TaxID=173990 RepID=A0A1H6NC69_9GAMM|nr:tail fiber protein [Rheinheimera pacifica]SEI12634.1 Microcystin-dependent protein [Rheinheimera pacifica]